MERDRGLASASAAASASKRAGPAANASRKRTKTGCRRCRIRRRKCDEGKPQCKRCADRNLDCQYPSGFTFLEKNILTLEPNPKTASAPRYPRLQFVEGRSPGAGTNRLNSPKHEERVVEPDTPARIELTPYDETIHASSASMGGDASPNMLVPLSDQHFSPLEWDPSPEAPGTTSEDAPGTTASDGLETALQVLVSLSSDPFTTSALSSTATMAQAGTGQKDCTTGKQCTFTEIVAAPGDEEYGALLQHLAPTLSADGTPQVSIVYHLRHYRYHVAPWLDICDTSQFFGTVVPAMAARSAAIHHALLGLSAASLHSQIDEVYDGSSTVLPDYSNPEGASDKYIATLLLTVGSFIRSTPTTWQSVREKVDSSFVSDETPALGYAKYISCLRLRLDLSVGLLTGKSVSLEHTPISSPFSRWDIADWAGYLFRYTNKILSLCARAVNFCYQYTSHASNAPGDAHPGITPAQEWRLLAEDLNEWYSSRPQELQPMVELDLSSSNTEPLFPAILFTNGAAILGNQIYHTAMMLMLQHKPKTLVLNGQRSLAWSPLWHGQRVCGIALNNERRECWDLLLLVSFFVAARSMTYEPQQLELLHGFNAVSSLTKWDVDHFKLMLRQEWGMPDIGR